MKAKLTMVTMSMLFLATINSQAVVFTNLCIFTGANGALPMASLVLSGNTLYGTTSGGGDIAENGTVFKVNIDGTGFALLHSFTEEDYENDTNSDGALPYAGLILSGNTLYGTTYQGGNEGWGTVFAINADGTDFTNLHSFSEIPYGFATNIDGVEPDAGLVLSGNTLFGTTEEGGNQGYGTVFAINTDGTGFTNLYNFNGTDGATPRGGLVLSGNTLYGTTLNGGSNDYGTIFKINIDGTDFTNLYSFDADDGFGSSAGLVLSGNILYGVTMGDDADGGGTVFKINTDGTDFTNLYSFTALDYATPLYTNNDGSIPYAGLFLSGNTLYGMTSAGGINGNGTVFALNTDGTGFTNLYNFNGDDGDHSLSGLILSENTLYGATYFGGTGDGNIFALSLGSIPLNIQTSGSNMVLTWGNPAFSLQVAPTPTDIYTNVPGAASPYTNTITGSQMFFRLKSN